MAEVHVLSRFYNTGQDDITCGSANCYWNFSFRKNAFVWLKLCDEMSCVSASRLIICGYRLLLGREGGYL